MSKRAGFPLWHYRNEVTIPAAKTQGYAKYHAYFKDRDWNIVSDFQYARLLNMDRLFTTIDERTAIPTGGSASETDRDYDIYTGAIFSDQRGLMHDSLMVDVSTTSGAAGDATINLLRSDDGGINYGPGLGYGNKTIADPRTRIQWYGLGFARTDRSYNIQIRDSEDPVYINAAYLEATECNW